MKNYLSKQPYTAPSYEEMLHKGALLPETTKELYQLSVERVKNIRGLEISDITYESDELKITGVEVLPKLKPNEKIPLIIYNRGGSGNFGMLSAGQISGLMAPLAQRMRAGVLASNYRGNGGSDGREEWGGADVNDILHMAELGMQQPWWDGKNIFMIGWSRGGMMTHLALKKGMKVNAAVVGAGVSDLFQENTKRPEMEQVCSRFIPDYINNREANLTERSAIFWPEKIHTPLLLLHGDNDWRVDVEQARQLHQKLEALAKPVKYIEFAGGDHGLTAHREQVIDEVVKWFDNYKHHELNKVTHTPNP